MHHATLISLLAAATGAAAQSVVGTAYGMATGVTGGGAGPAVTPTTNEELGKYMSDTTSRVIVLNKEFDFTGKKTSGPGCDRKECSAAKGGQFFLGTLSCGGSDTVPATVSYDAGSDESLTLKGNKTILGVGGKGVIKGRGIKVDPGASNIIIQGITMTNLNPGIVWGGDAIFLNGNQGVWIDHCKFSLIGRMFIVSGYSPSRMTLSNNEFDGVTTTSSTCNNQHYWTMMFTDDGDMVTLDKNYFHNLSGRAPKLGAASAHATNNYFENMDGHAFDANEGVNALIEGNVFKGVKQPSSDAAAASSGFYSVASGGAACQSALGRACVANSVDATSGKLGGGQSANTLTFFGKDKRSLVAPAAAGGVAASVLANAGPAKLGAASGAGAVAKPISVAPSSVAEAAVSATRAAVSVPAVAASSSKAVAVAASSSPAVVKAPSAPAVVKAPSATTMVKASSVPAAVAAPSTPVKPSACVRRVRKY
jgi:pectate lyase